MAKSKKSKILAMALCASVMTGIYAAPVMAGSDWIASNNASVGVTDNGEITFTIDGERIGTITKNQYNGLTELTLNGTRIMANGSVLVVGNGQINLQSADAILDAAAGLERTAKGRWITPGDGTTTIEKTVSVNKWGLNVLDENGDMVASINSTNGGINAANNKFHVYSEGQIEGTSLSLKANDGAQNVLIDNSGTARFGAKDGNNVRIENGVLYVNRNSGQVAALGENGLTLTSSNNIRATLNAEQIANINSVVQEGGNVVANSLNVANGAFEVTNDGTVNGPGNFTIYNNGVMYAPDGGTIGGVRFNNDGSVAGTHFSIAANGEITATNFNAGSYNLVEVGNDLTALQGTVDGTTADITALEQKTAGISKSGPVTTVEGVSFAQGGMDADYVLTDGLKVNGDGLEVNGLSNLDGVRVQNGTIYAENDSYIGGVQLADGLVDGVNMENLKGIERIDYGNGVNVTKIEGVTEFDNTGMGVYTDTGASVIGGGRATFNDGESTTSIIGGAITAKTLNGKVIDNLVEGSDIADDLANIAGISRQQDENGVFYTNIEGTLTVSENGLKAEKNGHAIDVNEDGAFLSSGTAAVYASNNTVGLMADANNYISITNNGIGLKGNVVFDTENYGPYSLSGLVDKVEDIYNRTQGIDYDSSTGTTTIDGNLDVKGDTEIGAGGNENVDGNITAGGDITAAGDVYGTNGNFDKVTTGEISADKGNIGNSHFDENGITVGAAGGQHTTITDTTVDATNGYFDNLQADKADIGGVGLESGTVTADKVVTGNTTLDNEGLNVGGQTSVTADGVNVGGNGGTTVSKDGVSIADKTIISDHDVVINSGTENEVSLSDVGNRVGNLEQGVAELNNRVGELEDRIDKVGAMAAAIANLRTMGYDPAAPTEVAVGIGQYRDETGAALGLFHYPNRDFMLSLSVSTSGDEVMGGIGATWKFGRKSPEKVAEIKKAQAEADARRAEEAKLAKAEEMKQAAKEAKIKAQQERHAKLAAERAAQAEAAK